MERGEFNDLMKDAFKDAEVTPSDNVWTNIELELEKEEGGAIRRRLFYYKMVAAASVIFAVGVAAASLYVLNSSSAIQGQQASLNKTSVERQLENQDPSQKAKNEIGSESNIAGNDSGRNNDNAENDGAN